MDIFKSNIGSLAMLVVAVCLTIVVLSAKGCDSPAAIASGVEATAVPVANAGTDGEQEMEEPVGQCVTGADADVAEVLSLELRGACRNLAIVDTPAI